MLAEDDHDLYFSAVDQNGQGKDDEMFIVIYDKTSRTVIQEHEIDENGGTLFGDGHVGRKLAIHPESHSETWRQGPVFLWRISRTAVGSDRRCIYYINYRGNDNYIEEIR